MLPSINGEFRLAADPELRFAPSGVAVCGMRLVASKRKQNEAGEWVDDKVFWVKGTCFRDVAEHAAESFEKGDLVIILGTIETEEWTTEGGEKRSAPAILINEIGPSARFRTFAHGAGRTERSGGGSSRPADPWATGGGEAAPTNNDEPPF